MSIPDEVMVKLKALHKSDGGHNPLCHCGIEGGSGATCIECRSSFPCPTIVAILPHADKEQK